MRRHTSVNPGRHEMTAQPRDSRGFSGRHGVCDGRGGLRSLVLLIALAFATSSCLVSGDTFGGRFCKKNEDCPGVAGYICASTAIWPQRGCDSDEDGCLCEVRFPPEPGGISIDGGGPVIPDAGPPPDYCTEIKPIIDLYCLGTCHGSQMQYPGNPTDFRLDYWEPRDEHRLPDGGPGLPGVKSKVERIKVRIYDEPTMPPSDFGISPSAANRRLVRDWYNKFGAPLGPGLCELGFVDAGTDGGTDAGRADGGVDAGPPPSFATDVLPILTMRCAPCHTTQASGGLSLTPANAYNQLVNVQVSGTCAPVGTPRMRVLPNAPNNSQMWLKLSDNANKCGNFMPRTNPPLMPLSLISPAQFAVIDRWIRTGARP